jgi:hypothetical protein
LDGLSQHGPTKTKTKTKMAQRKQNVIKIPTQGLTQLEVEQQIQEITQACPPSPIPLQPTTPITQPNEFKPTHHWSPLPFPQG